MTTTAQLYDRLNVSIERNEEMTLAQKDFLSLGPDEYVIMPDGSKIPSNAMLVKMLGGQVTSVNGERGDVEISADSLGLGSAAFRPAQDFMPNSKEIIKTVESIEDLMALTGMADGDVVCVKSYHDGLNKGGGTFVYRNDKKNLNDMVVNFGGWSRNSFLIVTSEMAGCIADRVSEDRFNMQRGIDYCTSVNQTFWVCDGVHSMNSATFERWGSENLYQTRCYMLSIKSKSTKIVGLGALATIKYGDGVTYTGWDEVGYVGAQLFCDDHINAVDGFEIDKLIIDGNGYNNKIRGVNGGGSAAGNQAVQITIANGVTVQNCTFKDMSGYQVIQCPYGVLDVKIYNNKFIDAGWLDGTNWTPNYTDQSTVYLGGTYECRGNTFVQNTKGMFAGTAFELHGVGSIGGNTIHNYASCFLSAAVVQNARQSILANQCFDCTMLMGTDTQQQWSNHFTLQGNYFRQNTMRLSEDTLYGKYRGIVYCFAAYNPKRTTGEVSHNTIETDGLYVDSDATYLQKFNSVFLLQQVDFLNINNNTINGHRGSLIRLLRMRDGSSLSVSKNTLTNCGVVGSTDVGNSIIYADNDADAAWGQALERVVLSGNDYNNCHYAFYLGTDFHIGGLAIVPKHIDCTGDTHNRGFPKTLKITESGPKWDSSYLFDIKVVNPRRDDNTIYDNPEENYQTYNQFGEIKIYRDKTIKTYKKSGADRSWLLS